MNGYEDGGATAPNACPAPKLLMMKRITKLPRSGRLPCQTTLKPHPEDDSTPVHVAICCPNPANNT